MQKILLIKSSIWLKACYKVKNVDCLWDFLMQTIQMDGLCIGRVLIRILKRQFYDCSIQSITIEHNFRHWAFTICRKSLAIFQNIDGSIASGDFDKLLSKLGYLSNKTDLKCIQTVFANRSVKSILFNQTYFQDRLHRPNLFM